MAALTAMNVYICANVLLVLAAALLAGIRALRGLTFRHQLRLGQILLTAAVLLPICSSLLGRESLLPQTAQVWSAPTLREGAIAAQADHRIAVSAVSSATSMSLDAASQVVGGLFLLGCLILVIRIAFDGAVTMRVIAGAQTIRRHRRLRILASDQTQVPFSFWLPTRYFIVVPSALVPSAQDLRIAIRHEAQHHRQQDTKWLYLYAVLKAAFFWNPAIHRLDQSLRELQEFACDEALSDGRHFSTQDYCQCLLRVAEAAAGQRRAVIHAGMVGSSAGKILQQRIETLLARSSSRLRTPAVLITAIAALTLMSATALAFTSTIQDRRISAEEAGQMAAVAQQDGAIPIVVNERVLKQLNLLLATPDGRQFLQAGLERMRNHQAFVEDQLTQHGLPLELLAVPLVESGYRNLPQSENPRHGAGIWMFIRPTAQRFGLTIDSTRDDRLNVSAETAAAMRMFTSLYRQFNDWSLALLAYNAGNAQVENAIRQTGSRNVWELIDRGYQNDSDYVPRVIATILILKNPSVLEP